MVDVPVDFLVDLAGVLLLDLAAVKVRLAVVAVLVDLLATDVDRLVRGAAFVDVRRVADALGAGSAIANIRGWVFLGIAART